MVRRKTSPNLRPRLFTGSMAKAPAIPPAPLTPSRRTTILFGLALVAVLSFLALGLQWGQLLPHGGGVEIAGNFFAAAVQPAFTYEGSDFLPADAPAFLLKVGLALWRTLLYAVAAISLALVLGAVFGVLASEGFWQGRRGGAAVRLAVRWFMAVLRSVHELIWALLFLAAIGLSPAAAVMAIALPYGGTLAKVFAEMLDESSPAAANALHGLGARPLQVFLFGRLPRALADIAAYAFYRFECAVRSSAVLGFFGYTTLGLYIRQSFENLHYREVWAYLYALLLLVLALEAWSSQIRRRFVA